jgi:uncharacterized membrane protein YccC
MAGARDDDSTDIEAVVRKFADTITDACADLRKARQAQLKKEAAKVANDGKASKDKPPADPAEITFALDPSSATKSRTPAEQAAQVAAGRS